MKPHRLILAVMMPIAVAVLMTGCDRFGRPRELTFSGTIELNEHALGPKAAGRLASLNVDEGSEVKRGDVIATTDRYEQAKRDYERAVELQKQGGANQQSVEYAQLAMDDHRLVSPVDGVVLVKVHELGEVVGAGSPVVVVGDRSHYWVRVFVPEGVVNRIALNAPAQLHFDGIDQSFNGHVSFIASKAEFTPRNIQTAEERVTQTFAVKITVDHPPEFLRPGVACDVHLPLKD